MLCVCMCVCFVSKAKAKEIGKKKKAQAKEMAKKKKKNEKPKSWLKMRPQGCSKCRKVPGCTLSCWIGRGGPP